VKNLPAAVERTIWSGPVLRKRAMRDLAVLGAPERRQTEMQTDADASVCCDPSAPVILLVIVAGTEIVE
jgi:hypothetical protein